MLLEVVVSKTLLSDQWSERCVGLEGSREKGPRLLDSLEEGLCIGAVVDASKGGCAQ